jgi:hypothetical protein
MIRIGEDAKKGRTSAHRVGGIRSLWPKQFARRARETRSPVGIRFTAEPKCHQVQSPSNSGNLVSSRRGAFLLTAQLCAAILPSALPRLPIPSEQPWSDATYWNDDGGWRP